VGKETKFATYGGRVYAFCCTDCKPDFDKDPANRGRAHVSQASAGFRSRCRSVTDVFARTVCHV